MKCGEAQRNVQRSVFGKRYSMVELCAHSSAPMQYARLKWAPVSLQRLIAQANSVSRSDPEAAVLFLGDAISLARASGSREAYLKALGRRANCLDALGRTKEASEDWRALFFGGLYMYVCCMMYSSNSSSHTTITAHLP